MLFPGTFPSPTDAKPWQTAALRTLWFLSGDGSVRGGCSQESTGVSCAPGHFCKSSSRAHTGPWMQEVLWSLQEGAPGSGDCGPGHRGPDTPGPQGLVAHPPQLSQLAEIHPRGPQAAQAPEVTQTCSKGLQGDKDISVGFVLGCFCFLLIPLLSSLKGFC